MEYSACADTTVAIAGPWVIVFIFVSGVCVMHEPFFRHFCELEECSNGALQVAPLVVMREQVLGAPGRRMGEDVELAVCMVLAQQHCNASTGAVDTCEQPDLCATHAKRCIE